MQYLVYFAQTSFFDIANAESLGDEHGKMIVKDRVKQNILIKTTGCKSRGLYKNGRGQ